MRWSSASSFRFASASSDAATRAGRSSSTWCRSSSAAGPRRRPLDNSSRRVEARELIASAEVPAHCRLREQRRGSFRRWRFLHCDKRSFKLGREPIVLFHSHGQSDPRFSMLLKVVTEGLHALGPWLHANRADRLAHRLQKANRARADDKLGGLFQLLPKQSIASKSRDRVDASSERRVEMVVIQRNRCFERETIRSCLLYTSPSPRDRTRSRMPSSA